MIVDSSNYDLEIKLVEQSDHINLLVKHQHASILFSVEAARILAHNLIEAAEKVKNGKTEQT